MSRTQSHKALDRQDDSQAPLALMSQDDSSENFNGYDSAEFEEKDATELELEKLVFGDELGFFDGLKSLKDVIVSGTRGKAEDQAADDDDEVLEEEEGLEGVDDADVRTRAVYSRRSISELRRLSAIFSGHQSLCNIKVSYQ